MWCRTENLCHTLRHGSEGMYLAEGGGQVKRMEEDREFLKANLHVFEGDSTVEADKLSLVLPILGLCAPAPRPVPGLAHGAASTRKRHFPRLADSELYALEVVAVTFRKFPIGMRVRDDTRGVGTVAEHTHKGKVSVRFDASSEQHQYATKSLRKLAKLTGPIRRGLPCPESLAAAPTPLQTTLPPPLLCVTQAPLSLEHQKAAAPTAVVEVVPSTEESATKDPLERLRTAVRKSRKTQLEPLSTMPDWFREVLRDSKARIFPPDLALQKKDKESGVTTTETVRLFGELVGMTERRIEEDEATLAALLNNARRHARPDEQVKQAISALTKAVKYWKQGRSDSMNQAASGSGLRV